MTLKSDVAPPTSDVTCIIAVAFFLFFSLLKYVAVMRRSQKKYKARIQHLKILSQINFISIRERAKLPTRFCDTWLKRISNYAYLNLSCMPFFSYVQSCNIIQKTRDICGCSNSDKN